MYKVSDALTELLNSNKPLEDKLSITITFSDETSVNYSDGDIVEDGFSVDDKCVNSDELCYGSVWCAELKLQLKTTVNRYKFYGASVKVVFSVKVDGLYEDIPCGEYVIQEAVRNENVVSITADDNMIKFQKSPEESFNGSVYSMASYICKKCDISFGMTESEVQSLTNGTMLFSLADTNDVESYRDVISYLSQLCCCFATCDRNGKLIFVPFMTSSCMEIEKSLCDDPDISDYDVHYTSISTVSSDITYISHAVKDDGMAFSFNENPLIKVIDTSKKQIVIDNMMSELQKLTYVPGDIEYAKENPTIDLGDMITINTYDVNGDAAKYVILVTSYSWSYRGGGSIKSVGRNPLLASTKTSSEKQISAASTQIQSKKVYVFTYTNTDAISTKNSEEIIIEFQFYTDDTAIPIVIATVELELDVDGYVIFTPYVNNEIQEDKILTDFLSSGKHLMTLMWYTESASYVSKVFKATIQTALNKDSTERKNTARITALESFAKTGTLPDPSLDSTIPTVSIKSTDVKAVMIGQGIGAKSVPWDGTLNIVDTVDMLSAGKITIKDIEETLSTVTVVQSSADISENVEALASGTIVIDGIGEMIVSAVIVKGYTASVDKAQNYTFDSQLVDTSTLFALKTSYKYTSTDVTIDSGSCSGVSFDASPFTGITSIEVI